MILPPAISARKTMMLELQLLEIGAPPPAELALLDCAGPLEDARVLVIGEVTLGVMCALIRQGCGAAVEMKLHECAHPEPADVVLAPHVTTADQAVRLVAQARRALPPGGRVVLHDASGRLAPTLSAALRQNGFSAVATHPAAEHHPTGGVFITAERPSFGPRLVG
jgi:hypothetical protein